ncbi:MAG: hypothetical protein ACK5LJ_11715 [Paracoccus sp. (in: a-proteobacteria)]
MKEQRNRHFSETSPIRTISPCIASDFSGSSGHGMGISILAKSLAETSMTFAPLANFRFSAKKVGVWVAEGARQMMIEVEPAVAGPGALVLFRMTPRAIAKHVGILTGRDTFLHAYERLGVIEEPLTPSWRRRIAFAFLFPPALRPFAASVRVLRS